MVPRAEVSMLVRPAARSLRGRRRKTTHVCGAEKRVRSNLPDPGNEPQRARRRARLASDCTCHSGVTVKG
ncbi:hypothetical protein AOLI_G00111120 [Acnodon oligacanthus]